MPHGLPSPIACETARAAQARVRRRRIARCIAAPIVVLAFVAMCAAWSLGWLADTVGASR